MAQRRGSKGEDLQVKEGESWGYFRLRKVKMEEKDKKKIGLCGEAMKQDPHDKTPHFQVNKRRLIKTRSRPAPTCERRSQGVSYRSMVSSYDLQSLSVDL